MRSDQALPPRRAIGAPVGPVAADLIGVDSAAAEISAAVVLEETGNNICSIDLEPLLTI